MKKLALIFLLFCSTAWPVERLFTFDPVPGDVHPSAKGQKALSDLLNAAIETNVVW